MMIMIEPGLFIDNILPSVGLYDTKLGYSCLTNQSEKNKCVGRIISCCDRMRAEIQLHESYDTWCEDNRAKDTITDSWSHDLKAVVITAKKNNYREILFCCSGGGIKCRQHCYIINTYPKSRNVDL